MSAMDLDVPKGEGGILRLFAIDTDMPEGAALRSALAETDRDAGAPAAAALGVSEVDTWWITHVRTADMGGMGLAQFLAEGYDLPAETLAADRDRLDRAEGSVMIVQSPAFGGEAVTLSPAGYLTPLAAYDTKSGGTPPRAMGRAATAPAKPDMSGDADGQGRLRALRPALIFTALVIAALIVAFVAFAGGTDAV